MEKDNLAWGSGYLDAVFLFREGKYRYFIVVFFTIICQNDCNVIDGKHSIILKTTTTAERWVIGGHHYLANLRVSRQVNIC